MKTNQDDTTNIPLTINNFLLVFKEFLIVWFNQILFYNKIYDPLIFDEYKAFELIIKKNRHPHLEKYIDNLLINIINNLIISKKQTNGLNKISCLIYNTKSNKVIKSYSIKFAQFLINLDKTINELKEPTTEVEDTSAKLDIPDLTWIEIYTQFQTVLFKFIQELKKETLTDDIQYEVGMSMQSTMPDNDLFFKITVDLDESIYASTENWIRLGQNEMVNSEFTKPLAQLDLDVINFDLVNEYYE
ncbi:uncharacterized protein KGF55_000350 [Candida pseudojiufengensis]|uniref:uncharacterized protein n=1 Tax=Candida pseudojiufengensis TaxID=497109 RepID=UPI0022242833|nr:uncharacterized protein KGF55_000350 [Candida pseudojiufengensis]KAI5966941.1 hypothetical protein KGF55_000350 [Candida pseudojiufengensis]